MQLQWNAIKHVTQRDKFKPGTKLTVNEGIISRRAAKASMRMALICGINLKHDLLSVCSAALVPA